MNQSSYLDAANSVLTYLGGVCWQVVPIAAAILAIYVCYHVARLIILAYAVHTK